MEYTSKDEVAVCNLASIALPKFLNKRQFDHKHLFEVTQTITENLNKIIDLNFYPIKEAENSNFRHRPIGIGVQGLADIFILMRLPFESEKAKKLNKEIFETIYFAALKKSLELSKKDGPYSTFKGSPTSEGILQFDMWNVKPTSRWDWDGLKEDIKKYGLRNSLLIAPMPTASTSQMLSNNECIEPYTTNIYTRRVLSGEFTIVNKHLMNDLIDLGVWNSRLKDKIILNNGSIQNIKEIPDTLKALYKTVWEISQKTLIDMARDRGAFIDQSQSLNLFLEKPDFGKMSSMHFYAWEQGLKTGMYYLRTQAAAQAIQFSIDKSEVESGEEKNMESMICSTVENQEECISCGS